MAYGNAGLSKFKSGIAKLARPNRFLVKFVGSDSEAKTIFSWDSASGKSALNDQYMVRSAQDPGKEIGDISNLYWFGQNYKIGGDPTYADLSLTFFNDISFGLKGRFEEWMEKIADTVNNTRGAPKDYKAIMVLSQLDLNNNTVAQYFCHGVFPKNIGTIELSHDTTDEVEKFEVSFNVDYWTNKGGGQGAGTEKGVAHTIS